MKRIKKLIVIALSAVMLIGATITVSAAPASADSTEFAVDKTVLKDVLNYTQQISSIRYIDPSLNNAEIRLSNIITYTRISAERCKAEDITQEEVDRIVFMLIYYTGETGQTYQAGGSPVLLNNYSNLTVLNHILAFSEKIDDIKYVSPVFSHADVRLTNIINVTKEYKAKVAAGGMTEVEITNLVDSLLYYIGETGQIYSLDGTPAAF